MTPASSLSTLGSIPWGQGLTHTQLEQTLLGACWGLSFLQSQPSGARPHSQCPNPSLFHLSPIRSLPSLLKFCHFGISCSCALRKQLLLPLSHHTQGHTCTPRQIPAPPGQSPSSSDTQPVF